MYQPLRLEQLSVDNELARLRSATLARRPVADPAPARHRAWWPRQRRNALRLAFAGAVAARASRRACVDC